MVKVIELPESLRGEICLEYEYNPSPTENKKPQPTKEEDKPRLQRKLDLGTPL